MTGADIDKIDDMYRLTPKVAKLCKPLFDASPVAFYSYFEFRPDGTLRYLTSHRPYFERFIEQRFQPSEAGVQGPGFVQALGCLMGDYRKSGFSLQDLKTVPTGNFSILESFDLGHLSILIQRASDSVVRVHCFMGRLDDDNVNDFTINNTNLLTYFSRYISKHARTLLKSVDHHVLPLDTLQSYGDWIQGFNSHPSVSIPYFLTSYAPHIRLSKQQRQLIYWYMMGKTTDETATILGLTKNTVNCYFDRLKKRFGCGSKPQIIAELLKNGVCFPELSENERFI